MKQFLIIVFFLILTLQYSCHKAENSEESKCIYESGDYTDTSLYLVFRMNGVDKKYYQEPITMYWGFSRRLIFESGKVFISRNGYRIRFSEGTDIVDLYFYKKNHLGSSEDNSLYIAPSEIFESPISVSYSTDNFSGVDPVDTIFMNGYSLNMTVGNDTLSTNNVFKYYKKDEALITSYFSETTFNVSNIELQCNDYYLIEGSFNTKILSNTTEGQVPWSLNMEKGKFRFVKSFAW